MSFPTHGKNRPTQRQAGMAGLGYQAGGSDPPELNRHHLPPEQKHEQSTQMRCRRRYRNTTPHPRVIPDDLRLPDLPDPHAVQSPSAMCWHGSPSETGMVLDADSFTALVALSMVGYRALVRMAESAGRSWVTCSTSLAPPSSPIGKIVDSCGAASTHRTVAAERQPFAGACRRTGPGRRYVLQHLASRSPNNVLW